jgi:phosphate transport system substrate-binding protein
MISVNTLTPVNTAEASGGVTTNVVPDVAFSDVFPSAAVPPIPDSAFTQYVVGVVPMVFVKNNNLADVTNISQDQAVFLSVNSGPSMPQTYLGGSSSSGVYLIGRDSGSGTRVTVEKCTKFVGSPVLWATNGAGTYVLTNGYSSGGTVRNVVKGAPDAIGYLSLGDWLPIAAQTTVLAYNGVPFNITNVYNGRYTIWGYEHLVHRVGGLSGSQQQVFNALKNAIIDPVYQETSSLYAPNFGELKKMEVERTSDGGPLSSLLF